MAGQASFENGVAARLVGTVRDITAQKYAENREHLLTQELNHRVKNLFAVVSSMISMTARVSNSPMEMGQALRGRVEALDARDRLAELQLREQNSEALAAAARNEERLGLSTSARRLVEERLDNAGLRPGVVDGQFDDDTRRAIRCFQEARNITKTGFLNQATMVRLLAEAIFQ